MVERETLFCPGAFSVPHSASAHEAAHAKINLCLHVTGQRADGYHLLDSLVAFGGIADFVEIEAGKAVLDQSSSLEITGPFGKGLAGDSDNLVLRAANRLSALLAEHQLPAPPVRMRLHKNLPIASGIGGGSADAAATLRLLQRYWKTPEEIDLHSLAAELGADVPMCLHSRGLRALETGTVFEPLGGLDGLAMVLINPGVPVSTPDVFRTLESRQNPAVPALPDGDQIPVEFLASLRNDLQGPAIALCPVIGDILDELQSHNACRLARMSGSGATCFGLFDDFSQAKESAEKIAAIHPDWWVVATLTQ